MKIAEGLNLIKVKNILTVHKGMMIMHSGHRTPSPILSILKKDILKRGIMNPLECTKLSKQKVLLIHGHKRLRILKEIGTKEVMCNVTK